MGWNCDDLSQLDGDLVSILRCGWNHCGDGLDHDLPLTGDNNRFPKTQTNKQKYLNLMGVAYIQVHIVRKLLQAFSGAKLGPSSSSHLLLSVGVASVDRGGVGEQSGVARCRRRPRLLLDSNGWDLT